MIFIETMIFTRLVQNLLTDNEYRELQLALIERPDMGPVIRNSVDYERFVGHCQGAEKAAECV